ncbi:MAG: DUF547 domain-containing protein [Desulfuromonadales bacterium]|nr:DUF547 domain-containing protein [Desulfuromonadales bacterium]
MIRILPIFLLLVFAVFDLAGAAPKADIWPRWQAHDEQSTLQVDHAAWAGFLAGYLVTDRPDGINRLRYGAVSASDRRALTDYLQRLQAVPVSRLNRAEQQAFWINLYNALTVKVVLDHYPVKSIRDINISPGWFSFGPWDAKLTSIEGEEISLNDIEHRILRPIWRDSRVHYAVNCASLGCPNLLSEPFSAANLDELLDRGARAYVNHPRGARFDSGRLTVSSIYSWFEDDFGGNQQGVLAHLRRFAEPDLAARLRDFQGRYAHDYDWSLNE